MQRGPSRGHWNVEIMRKCQLKKTLSKFVVASHPNVEAAINCDKVEAISRRPPATVAEHKRRIVATT